MTEAIVDVKGLTVTYHQRGHENLQLVKGIDFQVPKGSIVGIIGESGSGKSISMKSIMGILPEKIDSQFETFTFQGETGTDATQLPIAMIFQDPMTSLNPLRKISYHLAEIIFRNDDEISDEDAEKLAVTILTKVGITEPKKRLNQYPFELSGGMRQRIMIAMALMAKPELLIADEPTTALDVTIQAQILSLLKKLPSDTNLSIILVSHDFGVIAGMCDYVKVMYQGRVVEEGTVEDIFYSPQHTYTKKLLKAADLDSDDQVVYNDEQDNKTWSFIEVNETHRYLEEE
ncbi:ABC transporter ATP-binding protein [Streptococcus chenjunshii]|uniref:ABC transporter ATP-binding protein n=1 Tax=Streptococcus chenjunshii TaxID=2173853 RepID=A0A372KK39_9STRE|nr:ABC transporter ATP-binding protein [Streptococcus chenjunshii]AXQ79340.1 ABC transporter ATP-binding protein [Streptococcus chenjunshii]RFU50132.1 ABC transporter ATP-binding protein [Streptococcus chenjunshii]RFU52284.1 ABC transporter ATP-binding protein [Streptococcus chenjunshii]